MPLILNATQRFLIAELERSEANITWLDVDGQTELLEEYQRRRGIIRELMGTAHDRDRTLAMITARIQETKIQLGGLAASQPDDARQIQLAVDLDYLIGLAKRLQQFVTDSTYSYKLKGIDRL
jgi:hypothetical protein